MRAFDAAGDILQRSEIGGDHVNADVELLAHHAARIADAFLPVDAITDRDRVDEFVFSGEHLILRFRERAAHVVAGDLVARDLNRGGQYMRVRVDAGHVDDDFAQRVAFHRFGGHVFGGVDGGTDGVFGEVEIYDSAALDSLRRLIADAEHFDRAFVIDNTADKTRDFVRANIQGGQYGAFGFELVFH